MKENPTDSLEQQQYLRTIHHVLLSVTGSCLAYCRQHRGADDVLPFLPFLDSATALCDRARDMGLNFHRPLYQALMEELAHYALYCPRLIITIRETADAHPNETILCYRTAILTMLETENYKFTLGLLKRHKPLLDESSVEDIYRLVYRIVEHGLSHEHLLFETRNSSLPEIVGELQHYVATFLETAEASDVTSSKARYQQEDRRSPFENNMRLQRALEYLNLTESPNNEENSNTDMEDTDEEYESELSDDEDEKVTDGDDTSDDEYATTDDDEISVDRKTVESLLFRHVHSARVRSYFSMLITTERHPEPLLTKDDVRGAFQESIEDSDIEDNDDDIPDRNDWNIPDVTLQLEECNRGEELTLTTTFANYLWAQAEEDEGTNER